MKSSTWRIPLRVVFYKDGKSWIAHCLEFDLCGDGTTRKSALVGLSKAIALQLQFSLKHKNKENLFSPAPSDIQAMFFSGEATAAVGKFEMKLKKFDDVIIERPEYREYPGDRNGAKSGLILA
jgi:hypothetical protein